MTDRVGRRIMNRAMGRAPIKPLVDRILDGDLDRHLTDWRNERMSAADIAFKLRTDHGVTVSVATVARWVRDMETAA